jgi:hypothetical protein
VVQELIIPVAANSSDSKNDLITVSTGVVFRMREPSTWAITEVIRQMAAIKPQPPIIHDPDRGRDEPNDADPDYQAALATWGDRELERKYDVVIATGTKVEYIPEGIPSPDSAEWLDVLTAVGLPQPENMSEIERYIRWVKYVAAPSQGDWISLILRITPKAGTAEREVSAVAATFRDNS